jgi:putative Holliday junction resolvase
VARRTERRILAVDFGDRRTGLAATDFTGTIVVPLPMLRGLDDAQCAAQIAELASDRGSEVVVVGVPLDANGEVGARAKRTLGFVATLQKVARVPVETVDESHSTDEAHDLLKAAGLRASQRRPLADSVAARVILERFRSGR